jgi:RNA polymerase primary sigma factor
MAKQKLIVTDPSFKLYSKDLNKLTTMNTKRESEIKALMVDPNTSKEKKEQLKNELVTGYLRFVIQQASKLKYSGIDVIDLISEGNMGLMMAVNKFDFNSTNKFGTFARHWVRSQMMNCIYEHSRMIRLPQNVGQELHRQVKAFNEENKELENEYANLPYTIDLFKKIGSDDGDDSALIDIVANNNADNIEGNLTLKDQVSMLMKKLDKREQKVIKLLFGLDGVEQDLKEIAEEMNMNVESIRNIKNKAMAKMAV